MLTSRLQMEGPSLTYFDFIWLIVKHPYEVVLNGPFTVWAALSKVAVAHMGIPGASACAMPPTSPRVQLDDDTYRDVGGHSSELPSGSQDEAGKPNHHHDVD